MALVVLVVVLAVVAVVLNRPRELFCIVVRDGKAELVRGYAPPGLQRDFADVVRGVARAEIRAHQHPESAELVLRGNIDADTAQRLRNVLGLYPLTRLRAPRANRARRRASWWP